jgi:hypothetical protein
MRAIVTEKYQVVIVVTAKPIDPTSLHQVQLTIGSNDHCGTVTFALLEGIGLQLCMSKDSSYLS